MEYVDVIKRINELEQEDFTMDSLKEIGELAQIIYNIYGKELMNNKEDAKIRMMNVRDMLNCVAFDRLKEKLGFENEVIDTLLGFLDFFKDLTDAYVLDGNVIVKVKERDGKETSYVKADGFYDISSKDFTCGLDYEFYKCFFLETMNNALAPVFKEKLEKGKLLNINKDLEIGYNLDGLDIYINKSLKELMQLNTDVSKDVAKVLIKNNDELYYFDLKVHYAYFELAQNNYKINSISEMLKPKEKVKKR